MNFYFRWTWFILFLALLIPLDLPAGGTYKKTSNNIHIRKSNLYYANDKCFLRCSPSETSDCLRHIPAGTPLRLVRSWNGLDGKTWMQVQINSLAFDNHLLPVRGWINV